jgi:putative endonuclease
VSSSARGREGEEVASAFLSALGWTILERNYRWRGGEVDIIGLDGPVLAFVEVKSWDRMGSEELERAIGSEKRRKIIETSKIFLSQHREYKDRSVRYDVVLVRAGAVVERYPSAFTGEV